MSLRCIDASLNLVRTDREYSVLLQFDFERTYKHSSKAKSVARLKYYWLWPYSHSLEKDVTRVRSKDIDSLF